MGDVITLLAQKASRWLTSSATRERCVLVGSSNRQQLAAWWLEIHGAGNWDGLLDPSTRCSALSEFVQATSFDYDRFSPYCGSCRSRPRPSSRTLASLVPGTRSAATSTPPVMTSSSPTSLTGSTSPPPPTSCGACRAPSSTTWRCRPTRRRRALVAGTSLSRGVARSPGSSWVADLTVNQRRLSDMGIPCSDPDVKVEMGFTELYTGKDAECHFCRYSAREQLLAEVHRLVKHYHRKGEEVSVTVTGHSLGSELAMLNAFNIAEISANASSPGGRAAPVCVFSFVGPRVGNLKFREWFEQELGVRALRVVNVHNSVPKVPGVFLNEAANYIKKKGI
uniref:Fungal lipase-type domain-containing protein n=1 Tax=Setaria viridis TaxID=4556 RepID=A0A4U6UD26_SETVI|nr:hypothetical protein SEVIR_5G129900v2 [Setaria viridis]